MRRGGGSMNSAGVELAGVLDEEGSLIEEGGGGGGLEEVGGAE